MVKGMLQDPITPIMYGISMLHDHILFFLSIILFIVLFIFFSIIGEFRYKKNYEYKLGEESYGYGWRLPRSGFIERRIMDGRESQNYKKRKFEGQWLKLNNGIVVEIVWTIIPSLILLAIAVPSFALLFAIDEIAVSKLVVKVIGHQWYGSYEVSGMANVPFKVVAFDSYMLPDADLVKGEKRLLKTDNALILPKNMPILVLITSDDVLHSGAVPAFGIKVDAVPGRLSQVSLLIKNSGCFYGQCSELCGVNHGFMPIEIGAVDVYTYARLELYLNGLNEWKNT